jgi:hypothetical protein
MYHRRKVYRYKGFYRERGEEYQQCDQESILKAEVLARLKSSNEPTPNPSQRDCHLIRIIL